MSDKWENISGNDFLTQSYCESIARLAKTKPSSSFSVSQSVAQRRKKIWLRLFEKYSSNTSANVAWDLRTLQLCSDTEDEYTVIERVPTSKSITLVQHWVNTGNLWDIDYIKHNYLNNGAVKNKLGLLKELADKPSVKKVNEHKEYSKSLSCSSVNTAAYILSNANVTEKARATAIIKSTKIQEEMGSQESKALTEHNTEAKSAGSSENIFDPVSKNGINDHHTKFLIEPEPCVENSNEIESTASCTQSKNDTENNCNDGHTSEIPSQPLRESCESADIAQESELQSMESESSNTENTVLHNPVSMPESTECENNNVLVSSPSITFKESIEKALKCLTYNNKLASSHNEYDSAESVSEHDEFYSTGTENGGTANELKTHRKKLLYCGRDSPVDLANTRNCIGTRLSQDSNTLHPALDPVTPRWKAALLQKRKNQTSRRRKKWSSLFVKHLMNSTSSMDASTQEKSKHISQNGLPEHSLNNTLNTTAKGKFGRRRLRNRAIPQGVRKFRPERTQHTIRKLRRGRLNTSKPLVPCNLNAVVVLERLSNSIIHKHAAQKRERTEKRVPVVSLQRLTETEIQKYTNPCAAASTVTALDKKKAMIVEAPMTKSGEIDPSEVQFVDSDINSSDTSLIMYKCGSQSNLDSNLSDVSSIMDYSYQNRAELIAAIRSKGRVSNREVRKYLESNSENKTSSDELQEKENVNRKWIKTPLARRRLINGSQRLRRSKVFRNMKFEEANVHSEKLRRPDYLRPVVNANESIMKKDNNNSVKSTTAFQTVVVETDTPTAKGKSRKIKSGISMPPQTRSKKYSNLKESADALVSDDTTSSSIKSVSHMQLRRYRNTLEPSSSSGLHSPLVFQTSLIPMSHNESSNDSHMNNTPRRTRLSNTSSNAIKRNRNGLITLSSDEENALENIMQHLQPRKRACTKFNDREWSVFNDSPCVNKPSEKIEVVSNKSEDLSSSKSLKRNVFRSKSINPRLNETLEKIAAQDCITESDEDLVIRKSKRVPKSIRRRFTQTSLKRSSRIRSSMNFEKEDANDGIQKNNKFLYSATNIDSDTGLSNDERILNHKVNNHQLRKSSRRSEVRYNSNALVKKMSETITSNTSRRSFNCKKTKKDRYHFETRLYEHTDSELSTYL